MHRFRPATSAVRHAVCVAISLGAWQLAGHASMAGDPQAVAAGAAEATTDLQLLQGTWVCIASIKEGKEVPDFVGVRVLFEANRLTWFFPQKDGTTRTSKASFKIDPAQNPKHFDWAYEESPDKFHRRLYLIEDDVFIMSANVNAPSQRPESFTSGQYLFVVKRVQQSQ